MATLLDLAGIPAADLAAAPGQSMAPLLLGGGEPDAARPVHLFRHHFGSEDADKEGLAGQKYGVRVGDWKYVVGPEEGTHELYDLAGDPAETKNRVALEPERVDALARLIDAYRAEHTRSSPIDDAISDGDLERLRALGYVE
jgi:arylsulfatase A-like enzyme